MATTVTELERVVIRFAGDSGDGMQLTGDRFTQEAATFGNDLSTLPNFPAEIRAPQGTMAGVSSFQLHFADHDILTPGDRPDVLVAMNPAALKANVGDLRAGRHADRRHPRLHDPQPDQGRLRVEPARGRLARRPRGARDRPDRDDRRVGQGVRPLAQGRGAGQEHVRPRPGLVALRPRRRGHRGLPDREVRRQARHPRRQRDRAARRLVLRRDHRGLRGLLHGQARHRRARSLPQHHRQHRALLRPGRRRTAVRAAGLPRRLPDHAGLRHPPRAQPSTRTSTSRRSRPRTRSPASARRSGRRTAARWASPPRPGRAWPSRRRPSAWP